MIVDLCDSASYVNAGDVKAHPLYMTYFYSQLNQDPFHALQKKQHYREILVHVRVLESHFCNIVNFNSTFSMDRNFFIYFFINL